jgi:hypothetical protein
MGLADLVGHMPRSRLTTLAGTPVQGDAVKASIERIACHALPRIPEAPPQGAADYVDFVHVSGITYHASMRPMAGRALRESDLGTQVAVVRCKLAEHMVEGPDKQHLDGDAAYLDKGTALYAVKGYQPTFRLAARRDDQLVLFQAAENPRAQRWADLLDPRDKVRHEIAAEFRPH